MTAPVTDEFLLDTHVLLWALTDPNRLSGPARRLIANPANRLVVSAVSAWEISTKHRLGRLPHAETILAGYERSVARLGAHPLAITSSHALLGGALAWPHRDPFDRMLAAQAMAESLRLISADPVFADLPTVAVVW